MNLREKIGVWVSELGFDTVLLADGMDKALIGITHKGVAVYDVNKCINVLIESNQWTEEEACEWMDFNVVDAYVGEQTPIYIHSLPAEGSTT